MIEDNKFELTFMEKAFLFGFGSDVNKWQNVLVKHLKEESLLNRKILFNIAYSMVKIGIFFMKFDNNNNDLGLKNLVEDNAMNLHKVADLIWKNSWAKEDWNCKNYGEKDWYKEIIYSEDFKEICRTPIYLPIIYPEILSGEYILHLLHSDTKDDNKILKIEWNSQAQFEKDIYDDKLRKFFNSKNSCKKQFEKILNCSFGKFKGEKKNGILWELFEWQSYVEYDLYDKIKLRNFLSEIFDNPYTGGGIINSMLNRKWEIPSSYQGLNLIKTLLFQNMDIEAQTKIRNLVSLVYRLLFAMTAFVHEFQKYIVSLPRAETLKNDEKIKEYQNWIKEKMAAIPKLENSISENTVEIQQTKKELYKFVFGRIIFCEVKAIKRTYENTFILSPKILKKYNLYCQIESNEEIGVEDWKSFKEKYESKLKIFFSEITEEKELEKYWSSAVIVMAICFPMKLGLSFDSLNLPKKISVKWLEKCGVKIAKISVRDIFSMMCLIMSSREQAVELQRNNTIFYKSLLSEMKEENVERKGSLYEELRKIPKHYFSENKPDFNEAFAFQILWWVTEQDRSFFIAKETLNLFREFILSFLESIENILKISDLDVCLNELEKIVSWKNFLRDEMFNKNFNKSFQEYIKPIYENLEKTFKSFLDELKKKFELESHNDSN